ncbi:MAG TPA: methyltransferase domain-containing protein [Acidimicrobiia bacterium]
MTVTGRAIKVLQSYERRSRARRPVADAWKAALDSEVRFWERTIKNWQQLNDRFDPDQPLYAPLAELVNAPAGSTIKVIDVGAGLISCVGKKLPGCTVENTAVDALGDEYQGVLRRAGIEPPVWTEQCDSEKLSAKFGENAFDLAYARNTLDHSYDPPAAIREIVKIVKPGGVAMLEHAPDEAEEENYLGLHQWNLRCEHGRFVVWRRDTRIDMGNELAGVATVEQALDSIPGSPLHRVVLRKAS